MSSTYYVLLCLGHSRGTRKRRSKTHASHERGISVNFRLRSGGLKRFGAFAIWRSSTQSLHSCPAALGFPYSLSRLVDHGNPGRCPPLQGWWLSARGCVSKKSKTNSRGKTGSSLSGLAVKLTPSDAGQTSPEENNQEVQTWAAGARHWALGRVWGQVVRVLSV